MIRINLLGQVRPKSSRRPVDTGAALPVVFIGAGLVLGALVLGFFYYTWQKQRRGDWDSRSWWKRPTNRMDYGKLIWWTPTDMSGCLMFT